MAGLISEAQKAAATGEQAFCNTTSQGTWMGALATVFAAFQNVWISLTDGTLASVGGLAVGCADPSNPLTGKTILNSDGSLVMPHAAICANGIAALTGLGLGWYDLVEGPADVPYTVAPTDCAIRVSGTTTGAEWVDISLPAASTRRTLLIRIETGCNDMRLKAAGSDTFGGGLSTEAPGGGTWNLIASDGVSKWWCMATGPIGW